MRVVTAVALALAALVVAASAAAARDPRDPQQHHTAADTKLANSLALHQSDLAPGWSLASTAASAPPCKGEPDESNLVQTARIDPTFLWKNGVTSLGTEVDIFKTAAQAKVDWSLSTLHLFKICLLQSARSQIGKGFRVRISSAKSLPVTGSLAERVLHYQIVFSITSAKTIPVSIVSDVYALGRGRITVVMHSFTVRTPLPAKSVHQLLQILSDRLGAGGATA